MSIAPGAQGGAGQRLPEDESAGRCRGYSFPVESCECHTMCTHSQVKWFSNAVNTFTVKI